MEKGRVRKDKHRPAGSMEEPYKTLETRAIIPPGNTFCCWDDKVSACAACRTGCWFKLVISGFSLSAACAVVQVTKMLLKPTGIMCEAVKITASLTHGRGHKPR